MQRRPVLIAFFAVLGISVPLLPRLVTSLGGEGKLLSTWISRLGTRARLDTVDLLGEWLWILSPAVLLSVLAVFLLRSRLPAAARKRRATGLVFASIGTTALGWLSCQPVAGMGYDFYLGEVFYPLLAALALFPLYGIGWIIGHRRAESA